MNTLTQKTLRSLFGGLFLFFAASTRLQAQAGAALNFDGVDDYVETNANIAELGKGDFTIEAWIKTTGNGMGIVTCANANSTWESGEKSFFIAFNGRPYFVGWGNGYILGNVAVNDGNWHHVAVVWDYSGSGTGGTYYMYVDGVNQTLVGGGYAANINNIGTFKIGKQNYGSTEAPNNFNGSLDEIRIWNRVLCQPEIVNNMNCELPNPTAQTGLVAYYRFNSGTASGTNTAVTTVSDNSSSAITGTLTNFTLTGSSSNWVAPGGVTTGSSCSVYLDEEISLISNSITITDGDVTPSASDNTAFGGVCIGSSLTRTFTIKNVGTDVLTVSSISMTGADAASFSLSALSPASPIAAGGSSTFSVLFTPSSVGTKTAAINIVNSDCDEGLYDVVFSGTCNAFPVVSAATTNSIICNTATTSVNGSGASTYTWTGIIPATNGVAFSPSVTANYSVTGTNTLTGCTSTNLAVITITVNNLPIVSASAANASVCSGSPVSLSASGADTFTWSPGSLNGATVTPSPANTTSYSVVGTNTLTGCTSTNLAVQVIQVHALPSLSVVPVNATICANVPFTLTASGADSFTWNPGALTGSSIQPTLSTTTTYTLSGKNVDGCVAAINPTVVVTVNPLPTLSITPIVTTICAGGTASISASGANTYTWNPGALTGATVTPVLSASTVYTLTGKSPEGCSGANSPTVSVTVNPLPTVSITPQVSVICVGGTASLTASGASSYTWNPGGSNSGTLTPSPSAFTSYTLTGKSGAGCTSTNLATQGVTVNALPVVTATTNNGVICNTQTTSLIGIGADTYTWTPAITNGSPISPSLTTSYTVVGTSSLTGCTSTNLAIQTITVNPNPTITLVATNTVFCSGNSPTLTAANASTYTWTPGNFTTVVINPTPTSSTVYSVIGRSANGCLSANTATQAITVNPLPVVTASATAASVCPGFSTSVVGSGALTYSWSGGITNGLGFTPNTTGIYTVTGTDANFCSSTATITITVDSTPTVTANITSTTLCQGTSLTLSGSGAASYSWTGGVNDNQAFVPASTGSYSLTGYSQAGCASTNSVVVSVTVHALPLVTASASSPSLCAGELTTLSGSGAVTYTWTSGVLDNTAFAPATSAIYTVTGTDLNGCGNTATVNVVVYALPILTVSTTNTMICAGETTTLTVSGATSYSWSTGDSTPEIVQTLNGTTSFTVSGIDANGCSNLSFVTQMVNECTGLEHLQETAKQMLVYPNPTDGIITIETGIETDIRLLNVAGQVVGRQHLVKGKNLLDLTALEKGVYFVKSGDRSFKIIKD